jgi:hypothetical protein
MQDIGSKEDTELRREDLTSAGESCPVESLGHCPVGWKLDVFPRAREDGEPKSKTGQNNLPIVGGCLVVGSCSLIRVGPATPGITNGRHFLLI